MTSHSPAPVAHGSAGRHPTLESLKSLSGNKDPGLFGRMFPTLPPLQASDASLLALANAMKDTRPEGDPNSNNPNIPAGFTYLGQFVDHDITLDTTSLAEKVADPLGLTNFRTPRLDLDSVYGLGPAVNPEMFARKAPGSTAPGPNLLLGKTVIGGGDPAIPAGLPNDLPRNPEGQAIIGDPRNDENLLVAQTHLAFLKFHNAVVAWLKAKGTPDGDLFKEARRLTMWHYQWIVLFDFVERLTEPGLINKIRQEGRKFYRFKTKPYMPVEFAAAAYRLGHSMVRENYAHNRVFGPTPGAVAPGSLALLFHFSGKSGRILGDLAGVVPPKPQSPPNVEKLPSDWIIDWRRFFDFKTPPAPNFLFNPSRRLDPFVVPALHTLPGEVGPEAVLPFRNLKRGVLLGLPSGQSIAKAMKLPALTPAQIATAGADGAVAAAHGFDKQTPLWYYILKEAEVHHKGLRLGPVGSRIVAEVFLGIVHGDSESFMWNVANWKPVLPSKVPGTFTMTDLLQFVGDIDPIDGIKTVNTL